MREIKFQAWYKAEKTMYPVYGIWLNSVALSSKGGSLTYVTIEEVELLQFTGLYDRNGKEVYTSYIIKATLQEINEPPREVVEEVEIHDGFLAPFYMRVNYEEDWWKDCLVDGFEIIGTIYENPDLLKP